MILRVVQVNTWIYSNVFNERRDWAGDKKIASEKKTVLKIRVNKLCWKNEVINQQKEVKKWMSETFTNKQENSQTDVKKKKTRQ